MAREGLLEFGLALAPVEVRRNQLVDIGRNGEMTHRINRTDGARDYT
jgi:hypothetical protein